MKLAFRDRNKFLLRTTSRLAVIGGIGDHLRSLVLRIGDEAIVVLVHRLQHHVHKSGQVRVTVNVHPVLVVLLIQRSALLSFRLIYNF